MFRDRDEYQQALETMLHWACMVRDANEQGAEMFGVTLQILVLNFGIIDYEERHFPPAPLRLDEPRPYQALVSEHGQIATALEIVGPLIPPNETQGPVTHQVLASVRARLARLEAALTAFRGPESDEKTIAEREEDDRPRTAQGSTFGQDRAQGQVDLETLQLDEEDRADAVEAFREYARRAVAAIRTLTAAKKTGTLH